MNTDKNNGIVGRVIMGFGSAGPESPDRERSYHPSSRATLKMTTRKARLTLRHAESRPFPCRSAPSVVRDLPLESAGDHLPASVAGTGTPKCAILHHGNENVLIVQHHNAVEVRANPLVDPGLDDLRHNSEEAMRSGRGYRFPGFLRLSRSFRLPTPGILGKPCAPRRNGV